MVLRTVSLPSPAFSETTSPSGIDAVDVVAEAADHRVVAGSAVERIRRRVAGQHVGEGVAGAADGQRTGEQEIFDVGRQGVCHARLNGIVTLSSPLRDDIAGVVDDVEFVAAPASERVGTGTAIEAIRRGGAVDDVGQGVAGAVDGRGTRGG